MIYVSSRRLCSRVWLPDVFCVPQAVKLSLFSLGFSLSILRHVTHWPSCVHVRVCLHFGSVSVSHGAAELHGYQHARRAHPSISPPLQPSDLPPLCPSLPAFTSFHLCAPPSLHSSHPAIPPSINPSGAPLCPLCSSPTLHPSSAFSLLYPPPHLCISPSLLHLSISLSLIHLSISPSLPHLSESPQLLHLCIHFSL